MAAAPTPRPDEEQPSSRPWYDLGITFTPRGALALLALVAVGVAFSFGVDWAIERFVHLDERQIARWVEDLGLFGPVVYILLLAATIIFSPLPSVPVNIAGGLAFGTVMATLYVLAGGMIGATVNFYVARRLGRHWLERKLGRQAMAQIDATAERMGFRLIFFTRLIPAFNFDWVSYAAGLTAMRLRSYLLASLLGMLLPVIGIVYVGDVLLTHPGRSAAVFSALVVWSVIPPGVFLLVVGTRALRRRLARRGQPRSHVLARGGAPEREPEPVEAGTPE